VGIEVSGKGRYLNIWHNSAIMASCIAMPIILLYKELEFKEKHVPSDGNSFFRIETPRSYFTSFFLIIFHCNYSQAKVRARLWLRYRPRLYRYGISASVKSLSSLEKHPCWLWSFLPLADISWDNAGKSDHVRFTASPILFREYMTRL